MVNFLLFKMVKIYFIATFICTEKYKTVGLNVIMGYLLFTIDLDGPVKWINHVEEVQFATLQPLIQLFARIVFEMRRWLSLATLLGHLSDQSEGSLHRSCVSCCRLITHKSIAAVVYSQNHEWHKPFRVMEIHVDKEC